MSTSTSQLNVIFFLYTMLFSFLEEVFGCGHDNLLSFWYIQSQQSDAKTLNRSCSSKINIRNQTNIWSFVSTVLILKDVLAWGNKKLRMNTTPDFIQKKFRTVHPKFLIIPTPGAWNELKEIFHLLKGTRRENQSHSIPLHLHSSPYFSSSHFFSPQTLAFYT